MEQKRIQKQRKKDPKRRKRIFAKKLGGISISLYKNVYVCVCEFGKYCSKVDILTKRVLVPLSLNPPANSLYPQPSKFGLAKYI